MVTRHPKYKTQLCRTFHSQGVCPYGKRCHFIHNAEDAAQAHSGSQRVPHGGFEVLRDERVTAALQHALNPDGINIMQNNGAAAGQTVFHYHVHIIPRWENDGVVEFWQHRSIDKDVMETIADAIKHAMA